MPASPPVRHPGFAGLLLAVLVAGCGTPPPKPAAAPTEKPKTESDLARTTLSRSAYQSLAIHSEPLAKKRVQEHTPLTGWVMARQGHEVTLTAPVAGQVR